MTKIALGLERVIFFTRACQLWVNSRFFLQNWDFEFWSLGFVCDLMLVIWYLQFKFS